MQQIILGIDVEEWFQTLTFQEVAEDYTFENASLRSVGGLDWLLEVLSQTGNSATFFVNGECARACPDCVERIANAGHEVASHGFSHRSINRLSPDQVKADIQASRDLLTSFIASPVKGYRAPNWSADTDMTWLTESLFELGFEYDSSIFPMKTPWFGERVSLRSNPVKLGNGLVRVYPAICQAGPVPVPLGMGFMLRLLPTTVLVKMVRKMLASGQVVQLNIHSWELAETPPPASAGLLSSILLKAGFASIRSTMSRLLSEFKVTGINAWLESSGPELKGSP